MYVEDLAARVRGDNTLLSYSKPYEDTSQPKKLQPFTRALPSSPYEKAWVSLFDEIWLDELRLFSGVLNLGGLLPSSWVENQIVQLLNTTVQNSTQKIIALETTLQSITSVAYSLVVQQLRVGNNLTRLHSMVDVPGQQQTRLGQLRIHASQTFLGFFFVVILLLCILYMSEMTAGLMPSEDHHIVTGNVLDFICLMRGSSLPGLFAEPTHDSSAPEARRDRAEKTNVV